MSPSADHKRCYTCGATYAKEATVCSLDDTPLSPDTVGRRWRVDGLLGRRPGGGVFSAFHLVTGARGAVDLVPWPLSADEEMGGRLYRELQALRLLERHPHVPRLLETGTDRDDARFVVTNLGDSKPLRELWIDLRGEDAAGHAVGVPAGRATSLMAPILSLLAAAHRMGLAHGQLNDEHLYLREGEPGRPELLRLHGLMLVLPPPTPGPPLPLRGDHDMVRDDLRGAAAVLYQLLCGEAPNDPRSGPLPREVPGVPVRLLHLLSRALSPDPLQGFSGGAEELSRALMLAAPPAVPLDAPRVSMLLPALHSGRVRATMTGATNRLSLPPPLAPVAPLPQRSGLTSELQQVSLLDLIPDETPQSARVLETLAKSRNRPFTTAEMLALDPDIGAAPVDAMDDDDAWPSIEVGAAQSEVVTWGAAQASAVEKPPTLTATGTPSGRLLPAAEPPAPEQPSPPSPPPAIIEMASEAPPKLSPRLSGVATIEAPIITDDLRSLPTLQTPLVIIPRVAPLEAQAASAVETTLVGPVPAHAVPDAPTEPSSVSVGQRHLSPAHYAALGFLSAVLLTLAALLLFR